MNLSTDDIINIAEFSSIEDANKYEKLLSKEKYQYLKQITTKKFIETNIDESLDNILELMAANIKIINETLENCYAILEFFGDEELEYDRIQLIFDKEASNYLRKKYMCDIQSFTCIDFDYQFRNYVQKRWLIGMKTVHLDVHSVKQYL